MRPDCALCAADILWVVRPNGQYLFVDREPDPGGNVAAVPTDGSGTLLGDLVGPGTPPGGTRYRLHTDTCPHPAYAVRRTPSKGAS